MFLGCDKDIMERTKSHTVVVYLMPTDSPSIPPNKKIPLKDGTSSKKRKTILMKLLNCNNTGTQKEKIYNRSKCMDLSYSLQEQHLKIRGIQKGEYHLEALYEGEGYGTTPYVLINVVVKPHGKDCLLDAK